ncbi:hypothetical protein LAC79_36870 (plasmid) [Ensifer adhaerens]|nr:hypothetical protein [Ensifer adhaerens]MBZ7927321.1 hypothetical protein [Ensifer adhaerens]
MENLRPTPTAAVRQYADIYSLEEFAVAYDLSATRANDLYRRFGPTRAKLDTLMAALHHLASWRP